MTAGDQEKSTGQGPYMAPGPMGDPAVRLRPWRAPAILCAVAALVLVLLLIPGVLTYPAQAPASLAIDAETRRQSNQALEERVANLRRLVDSRVCVSDDGFQRSLPPASAPQDRPPALTPDELSILPQRPLSQTPVPPDAAGTPASGGSLLDLVDQATVLVLQSDAAGNLQGMGTGFLVAPGRIMTNRHVTGGPGNRIHIASQTFGVLEAQVLASTSTDTPGSPDFALLSVNSTAGRPLQIGAGAQRLLNVVAVGFPGLIVDSDERFKKMITRESDEYPEASVTDGVVTALQTGSGTGVVLHTAQITPGNSGGPLIDRCGRVVGINTFIQARQEGRMNYALAAADIARFLAAHDVQVSSATTPCTVDSHAAAPAGQGAGQ